jgi:hypothetical protein
MPKQNGRPPKTFALENIPERAREPDIDVLRTNIAQNAAPRLTKYPSKATDKTAFQRSLMAGGSRHHIMEAAVQCKTRSERTGYIAALMSEAAWRTAMVRPLAGLWGVSLATAQTYASDASRWVRGAFGDREEIRARCLAILEVVASESMEAGDNKTAVAAVRTVADIVGLVTTRHEHTGANGGPIAYQDLSRLTEEELEEAIVKAAANAVRAAGSTDDRSKLILAAESRMAVPDAVIESADPESQ